MANSQRSIPNILVTGKCSIPKRRALKALESVGKCAKDS